MKRKLKLQMQTSLDGFVSTGPNDEQGWVTWALAEIQNDVLEISDSTDTILLGRKLAVDYIPFWLDTATKPDHEMIELAKRIVSARKIIFSKTLDKAAWPNTELAKGDLVEEVDRLKQAPGKGLVVYGGSEFVSALIEKGLIDEFHFFVNPVVLGKGVPVFNQLNAIQQLKLKRSKTYPCGIVLLSYEKK